MNVKEKVENAIGILLTNCGKDISKKERQKNLANALNFDGVEIPFNKGKPVFQWENPKSKSKNNCEKNIIRAERSIRGVFLFFCPRP